MKYTLIIIASLVIFSGCKKEEQKGRLTFWNDEFTGSARLYVDGENMGIFQGSIEAPNCGDAINTHYITIEKLYGEHTYWVTNNSIQYPAIKVDVNSPCQIIKVDKP
jgi:hypothetical protein